ncbi:MAG: copper oxidase [bacterium]|nr:copper oxidase [bacterium]
MTWRVHAKNFFLEFMQTALRLFPWPTQPGLRTIGRPDASSPVLLTGNFDLTVRRLVHALEGVDAWLLVAPSGGINVWCASSGGHLTTHQVVTALKTTGIADKVDHRQVILPQLAATGVLALDVFRRSRWKVRFGPVDMHDIPAYLEKREKTDSMRRVTFPLSDRLQMALMWGAPTTVLISGLALWLAPKWAAALALLIAAMSVGVFTLYDRLGEQRRWILLGVSAVISFAATWLAGGGAAALTASLIVPAFVTTLLTFDYTGSTPLEGGSHFEERTWHIAFDETLCDGIYRCWEVCPQACFEKDEANR